MSLLYLETYIEAPIQRVFDLSRSIDFHLLTGKETHETVVAGRASGLIELQETVTWRAKHFGIYQKLASKIIEMEAPFIFTVFMQDGPFAYMRHVHKFKEKGAGTLMIDDMQFRSPLGWLGKAVDALFLKRYMTHVLRNRNTQLKEMAEGEGWKAVLERRKERVRH